MTTVQLVRELKDAKYNSWESWQACMAAALAEIRQAPRINKYDDLGAFDLSVPSDPGFSVPYVVLYCDVKNTAAQVTCYLPMATKVAQGASRKGADTVIIGALRACTRQLRRTSGPHVEWFTDVVRAITKGQVAWEMERDKATTLRLA